MATGIKDKVAILGMGCSQFGERWDKDASDLMAEAFDEALLDAGIEREQIEAAWYGCCNDSVNVGNSAIPASTALRLEGIPVSRVENMCATGTEALRGAAYAVASGLVYDPARTGLFTGGDTNDEGEGDGDGGGNHPQDEDPPTGRWEEPTPQVGADDDIDEQGVDAESDERGPVPRNEGGEQFACVELPLGDGGVGQKLAGAALTLAHDGV